MNGAPTQERRLWRAPFDNDSGARVSRAVDLGAPIMKLVATSTQLKCVQHIIKATLIFDVIRAMYVFKTYSYIRNSKFRKRSIHFGVWTLKRA